MATLIAYVNFNDGKCADALNFYQSVFGGEIKNVFRFKDAPAEFQQAPELAEHLMHGELHAGKVIIYGSDSPYPIDGAGPVSFMLEDLSVADAESFFEQLSAGGEVMMPLSETFWAKRFGMAKDRFGISWMISVAPDVEYGS